MIGINYGDRPHIGFVLRPRDDDKFRVNRANQQSLARAAARAGFMASVLDPSQPGYERSSVEWRRTALRHWPHLAPSRADGAAAGGRAAGASRSGEPDAGGIPQTSQ